jgi:hypothetical protein
MIGVTGQPVAGGSNNHRQSGRTGTAMKFLAYSESGVMGPNAVTAGVGRKDACGHGFCDVAICADSAGAVRGHRIRSHSSSMYVGYRRPISPVAHQQHVVSSACTNVASLMPSMILLNARSLVKYNALQQLAVELKSSDVAFVCYGNMV